MWFVRVIRKLYATYMVISFSKVYSSIQTLTSVYKDTIALNGLLIRTLQANPSVQTSVVKNEVLSEKEDCTRAHCSHVPWITNGAFSRSVSCEMHNSIVAPSLGLLRGVPTDSDTKLLFLAPLPSSSDSCTSSSAHRLSTKS